MVLLLGGTGFIGRRVAARLVEAGERVRVAARGSHKSVLPEAAEEARANVMTGEGLAEAMAGVDKVVHLVAVIVEKGEQSFDAVIRSGTVNVANEAKKAGVKKLVYISALGAAAGPEFPYWHAKWWAEQTVANSGLNYTIIRPSLVFGPDDDFFNRLADMARRFPVVPIAGNGKTKFQPIWVEDLVSCVVACLDEGKCDRRIIEVGGPEHLTYDEIVKVICDALGKRRLRVHVPLWLMRPMAGLFQTLLSNPPVTTQQLDMLSKDNITEIGAVVKQFGFEPKRLADGLSHLRER